MRFEIRDKPKIKTNSKKGDGFDGWQQCLGCKETIHKSELTKNLQCCPKCGYHFRFLVKQRIDSLADAGSFHELFSEVETYDRLNFVDTESYENRIKSARQKSKSSEAVIVGKCQLKERPIALGVFDFNFMGGSMSSCVGERLTLLIEYALEYRLPLIIVSASGGARMQESIFSLMQMAKTSAALAKLHDARIPFISVLTNPTSGGVTASFAALGDIIIAEPNALICFAGPRVVEQIIRQKLPEGAQKSEFLLKHGMIDCIVKRSDLKDKLASLLKYF